MCNENSVSPGKFIKRTVLGEINIFFRRQLIRTDKILPLPNALAKHG